MGLNEFVQIGNRLRKLRIEKGISQKKMAELTEIPYTTYSNYENNNRTPSTTNLKKIATVLNVDINDLYGVYLDPDMKLTHEEKQHIEKYRLLDDLGRETVGYILDKEVARTKELQKKNDRISELESNSTAMTGSGKAGTLSRIIQYFQSVSAGTGQVIFDDVYSERISIPDTPEYSNVTYAVKVSGHSMEPLYNDGDMLLIEPTCTIDVGEIGIFNVDGQAYVKKLGKGELVSLNTSYSNVTLTDDSRCMGRVVDKFTNKHE